MKSARLTYTVAQCNLVPSKKNAAPEQYGAKDCIPTTITSMDGLKWLVLIICFKPGGQKMSASSNFGARRLLTGFVLAVAGAGGSFPSKIS